MEYRRSVRSSSKPSREKNLRSRPITLRRSKKLLPKVLSALEHFSLKLKTTQSNIQSVCHLPLENFRSRSKRKGTGLKTLISVLCRLVNGRIESKELPMFWKQNSFLFVRLLRVTSTRENIISPTPSERMFLAFESSFRKECCAGTRFKLSRMTS